jgi:hypothetical protein
MTAALGEAVADTVYWIALVVKQDHRAEYQLGPPLPVPPRQIITNCASRRGRLTPRS